MAKIAKLTIYHVRSIQANVKYSVLLLQHKLKKLLYKSGGGRIMQMSYSFDP